MGVLHDADARRKDNVFSQALADFLGLSVRMCVVNHVARRLAAFRAASITFAALALSAVGLAIWYILTSHFGWGNILATLVAVIVAGLGLFLAHGITLLALRVLRQSLARNVDDIFAREYRRQIAIGTHDNIRQHWDGTRDETAEIIRNAPLHLPLFGEFHRKRLEKATSKILKSFHA